MVIYTCSFTYPRSDLSVPTENVIEAGDRDSFEAVTIFREQYADMKWFTADVKRFDGLTLNGVTADGKKAVRVHFTNCVCGYAGNGPIATMQILVAAGFGEEDQIWSDVSSVRNCAYAK